MVIEFKTFEINNKRFAEYIKVKGPYKWQTNLKDEACFIYWLNGENKLYTENSHVFSRGKDALLLKCGPYIDEVFSKENEEVEAVIVHFYPELLKKLFRNEIPQTLIDKTPTEKPLSVKLKHHILLEKYVDGLLFYFKNPELADQDLLLLKMKELFLLLSKTQQRQTLEMIFRNLFTTEEISFKEVIESNLYSGLSLKELAYLTQRSLATFKRDFQKYYQDSPSQYIKNRKLDKAAQLLLTTQMRVGDIAYECGFNNVSHFSRLFHQKYMVSPSLFRLSRTAN